MPRQHRITIKEIARMCGVSSQTVSRVINRRPDVSPTTRAAVEAAIASVGFQPSAVARSLVHRRSQTLGVITAGLRYFGVAQTLTGITEESEAHGYALLLKELATYETADIVAVLEFLIAHRVEGIIVAVPELGTNFATAKLPVGLPPIVYLKSKPSPAFSTIVIDNYGGAQQATRHLLGLGRRRIGHLSGPLDWPEARERHDGWRDALRDAGLEPGPVKSGDWSSASGERGFESLLRGQPDMDGVFVGNDQMAIGILRAAQQRGIRIPQDLAVVGFDGLDEAAQLTPSLTTIVQPLRRLGQLAVQELLATVNDDPANVPVGAMTLGTDLVVRESAPAVIPTTATGPIQTR